MAPVSSDSEEPAGATGYASQAAGDRAKVSEPAHKPATSSRHAAAQSLASIGSYLKDKVSSDRDVQRELVQVRKEKLELDRRASERADEELRMRKEREEKQMNAALAKEVLQVQGASLELRNAAESYLINLFSTKQ